MSLVRRFMRLPRYGKALVIAVFIALIVGLSVLLGNIPPSAPSSLRTVSLRAVSELSGEAGGTSVVGVVRSRSEAQLRAEAAGIVRSVNTTLGAGVPAGLVIAELENSSEQAQVTQAEGAYEAALAARTAASPQEVETAAKNAYRDAFTSLDTVLENYVDVFFGEKTPAGPDLLINPIGADPTKLQRERDRIDTIMSVWGETVLATDTRDPLTLLDEAETSAREVSSFVGALSKNAYAAGSDATEAQITAITSARTSVSAVLTSLSSARSTYKSNETASTASVDAAVKAALGTLRLAQATLEKTRIRAPIGGTVNYLPIRVGDYVALLDHVATVAQNGALEIVAFVSEETGVALLSGTKVMVEDRFTGTITSVAPALDPVTKQVEVHISVSADSTLVNGRSVRITFPGVVMAHEGEVLLLPLSSVKLSSGNRVVFTAEDGDRLKAIPVQIGEVRGERIEILTPLPSDLRVVTDARGLSDGQQVHVAP